MAALRRAGHRLSPAKVGPDFIDPGYHALASRPAAAQPRRLDERAEAHRPPRRPGPAPARPRSSSRASWACSTGRPTAADLDRGRRPPCWAPVVLVVDAGAMSRSVAALVHGFARYDPRVDVGGGDPQPGRLRTGTRNCCATPSPRSGCRSRGAAARRAADVAPTATWAWCPVAERPSGRAVRSCRLAEVVAERCDLDAVAAPGPERAGPAGGGARRRRGPARARRCRWRWPAAGTTFTYRDTLEALMAAGAEIVPFDPLPRPALPADAVRADRRGGFPEVYAEQLEPTPRCSPTCGGGSPACPPGRSVAACCGCAGRSTGGRWSGRSPPRGA